MGKILTLEEQRLARESGQRIGAAIAETEPRLMPALPKPTKCLAREIRLIPIERHNLETRLTNEYVEHLCAKVAVLHFENEARLHQHRRR